MASLTAWRIDLAAGLVVNTEPTDDSVARQVGYGSAFALSTGFKRIRGISSQRHRDRTWRQCPR
jgi:transcriptional regulator GlxA family with amidase domain